MSYMR